MGDIARGAGALPGAGQHGGRGGVPGAVFPADVGPLAVHEDRSSSASRAGSTGSTGGKGTLWEERFKSVLVEDGHAARTMAAYIDLNPVRAGMVDDPKDYRWCSYAEAVAGKKRAREGLQRVMFEEDAAADEARSVAAEKLITWRQAAHHYRQISHLALHRGRDRGRDPDGCPAAHGSRGAALPDAGVDRRDGAGDGAVHRDHLRLVPGALQRGAEVGGAEAAQHRHPLRTLRDLQDDPGAPPG